MQHMSLRDSILDRLLYENVSDEFVSYIDEIINRFHDGIHITETREIPSMCPVCVAIRLVSLGNTGVICRYCNLIVKINIFQRGKRTNFKCKTCKETFPHSNYRYKLNCSDQLYNYTFEKCRECAIKKAVLEQISSYDTSTPPVRSKLHMILCVSCRKEQFIMDFKLSKRHSRHGSSYYRPFCNTCILELPDVVRKMVEHDSMISFARVRAKNPLLKEKIVYVDSGNIKHEQFYCLTCKDLAVKTLQNATTLCNKCDEQSVRYYIDRLYVECDFNHWRKKILKLNECPACSFDEKILDFVDQINVTNENNVMDEMLNLCEQLKRHIGTNNKSYI